MSLFGDDWARSRLNIRAIIAIIGASILLIWALSLKNLEESRTFLHTETVMATINTVEIKESDARYAGKTLTYITKLTLPEGDKIQFMLAQSPPKVGTKVPVLIDKYDDDERYYRYNLLEWKML